MDSVFDDLMPSEAESELARWRPAMDVAENGDHLTLKVELPGMTEKDVTVRVDDGVIVIEGEKREEKEEEEGEYKWREMQYGSFYRRMALPSGTDTEHVNAEMKNGVLRVTLPKLEQAQGRRVEVKAA
jgi:HSP20 family protein